LRDGLRIGDHPVSSEEILDRLAALEKENEKLREENKRLRAKLRWYEGPHTPPSKDQSDQEDSASSGEDEADEQPRTDGGTPGRKSGHDPEWRDAPDPDREIEVTRERCLAVVKTSTSRLVSSLDSSRKSLMSGGTALFVSTRTRFVRSHTFCISLKTHNRRLNQF
jgi:hypothetical protein